MKILPIQFLPFCFAFFMVLISVPASAQSDGGNNSSYEEDDLDDDPEGFEYTNINDFWPYEDDEAQNRIIVEREAIVRYQTFARAYFRFNFNSIPTNQISIRYQTNALSSVGQNLVLNDFGEVVIPSIPINQIFHLIATVESDEYLIGEFSTWETYDYMENVDLLQHMFDPVSYWLSSQTDINIFQFVQAQTDWHQLEKIMFL